MQIERLLLTKLQDKQTLERKLTVTQLLYLLTLLLIMYKSTLHQFFGLTQLLTGAGAVDVVSAITEVVSTGAQAGTFADGVEGQIKFIVMKTDGGDYTITPTNFNSGSTITLNDAGDAVLLLFTNSAWYLISNQGATIA